MKDPQQTADELVEMYRNCSGCLEDQIQCAILHTQGIIDALNEITASVVATEFVFYHHQVLTILKARL